jgi:cation:H+ antiporter
MLDVERLDVEILPRMTFAIFAVLAGLALLYFGGEALVKGSASAALKLGLTPLVVGLTIVAFATSSPELVVCLDSALNGYGAIAVGNVVGSNILNIGLILGLSALVCPIGVQVQLIRFDVPVLIFASLLSAWMLRDITVGRIEGAVLLTGLIGYVLFAVLQARREHAPQVAGEFAEGVPKPSRALRIDLLLIIGGLALLVAGGRVLVMGAVTVARELGMSEALIGLTIVAAGTSMPEMATSIVAALRREPDIAIGNILGSNVFNLFGILGASALTMPLSAQGVATVDLAVMIGFAVALLPLLWSGFTLNRLEGALLLLAYGGYVFYLCRS